MGGVLSSAETPVQSSGTPARHRDADLRDPRSPALDRTPVARPHAAHASFAHYAVVEVSDPRSPAPVGVARTPVACGGAIEADPRSPAPAGCDRTPVGVAAPAAAAPPSPEPARTASPPPPLQLFADEMVAVVAAALTPQKVAASPRAKLDVFCDAEDEGGAEAGAPVSLPLKRVKRAGHAGKPTVKVASEGESLRRTVVTKGKTYQASPVGSPRTPLGVRNGDGAGSPIADSPLKSTGAAVLAGSPSSRKFFA